MTDSASAYGQACHTPPTDEITSAAAEARPPALSDKARAALYRARQRINGGRRATVTPATAALLRELLREALQRDTWTPDDRRHLEGFLTQLKRD